MLKIVVFDSGYGGEFFADELEEALPIVEIIRVIDWRHAEAILKSPKQARKFAELALRPYLNKVDLIIFANHLLSITSLKYFIHKYPTQKFLGLDIPRTDTFLDRGLLIITTSAVAGTLSFYKYLAKTGKTTRVLTEDDWPLEIDDGELAYGEVRNKLEFATRKMKVYPKEAVLACSQFHDIKREIKTILGHNTKIYDGFDDAIREACKILCIRGSIRKKKT